MKRTLQLFVVTLICTFCAPNFAHESNDDELPAQLSEAALGSVNFTNSCSKSVKPLFNQGVALLHSFWFAAAIKTFDEVLTEDPKCAMAEWGKAMANWGNPLGNNRAKTLLQAGFEAAARARKLPTGDARERDYIDAVAVLYDDFENTPDQARSVAFEKAMQGLMETYPGDTEAAIFYAMALNGSADLNDKTYAQPLRAAKILEAAFADQPNHPGIAHYIIHSYDVPSLAKHALPAARQYADIAPAAPHALHMPSHTFTRLGHWQESIDTNIRSADAALAADSPGEALHAIDYMIYAYLQTGQDVAAEAGVARSEAVFKQIKTDDRYLVAGAYAAAAVPSRFALERGDWQAAKQIQPVTSPAPFVDAIIHLAHGLGAARSKELESSRLAIAGLKASEEKLAKNAYWMGQVAIQRTIVEAWLALAENNPEQALSTMRKAVELEHSTEKSAISPGPLVAANEQLGEMLLELNQPVEALRSFRAAIAKEPGRFRGLYGAANAADAAGLKPAAKGYFAELVNSCANADADRPELIEARSYLQNAIN
ncbi:MAG: tetratricopeptide (TPR) repeat protein [Gammaproteobacteria bacterium]|jgi:tetratricopeptide (TPR) repeat protein